MGRPATCPAVVRARPGHFGVGLGTEVADSVQIPVATRLKRLRFLKFCNPAVPKTAVATII